MKRWIQKGTSFSVKRYLSDECFYSLLLDFAFEFGDLPFLNIHYILNVSQDIFGFLMTLLYYFAVKNFTNRNLWRE